AGDGTDHTSSPSRCAHVACRTLPNQIVRNITAKTCRAALPHARILWHPRNAENAALFERVSCKRRRLAAEAAGFVWRHRRGSQPCQLAIIPLTLSSKSALQSLPSGAAYATVRRRRQPLDPGPRHDLRRILVSLRAAPARARFCRHRRIADRTAGHIRLLEKLIIRGDGVR